MRKAGVGSPGEFDVPHFLQPLSTTHGTPSSIPPSLSPLLLPSNGSPHPPLPVPPSPRSPNVSRQRFAIPSTNEGPPAPHRRHLDDDVARFIAFNVPGRRGMGLGTKTKAMNRGGRCISARELGGLYRGRRNNRGGFFFLFFSNVCRGGRGGITRVSGGNTLLSEETLPREGRVYVYGIHARCNSSFCVCIEGDE